MSPEPKPRSMAAVTIESLTACSSENKSGQMLETPVYPQVLALKFGAVTIRGARTISRKDSNRCSM